MGAMSFSTDMGRLPVYVAITNELIILKRCFIYFLKMRLESLPIQFDFIAIRLTGSSHQEVYEYSIAITHTLRFI